jgi:hypothetical protein
MTVIWGLFERPPLRRYEWTVRIGRPGQYHVDVLAELGRNGSLLVRSVSFGAFSGSGGHESGTGVEARKCEVVKPRKFSDGSSVAPADASGKSPDGFGELAIPRSNPDGVVIFGRISLGPSQLWTRRVPRASHSASVAEQLMFGALMVRRVGSNLVVYTRNGSVAMPVFMNGGTMRFTFGKVSQTFRSTVSLDSDQDTRCLAGSIHLVNGQSVFLVDRVLYPWCRVKAGRIELANSPDAMLSDDPPTYAPYEEVRGSVLDDVPIVRSRKARLNSMVLLSATDWVATEFP